jgi:regulator of replication initiation timing
MTSPLDKGELFDKLGNGELKIKGRKTADIIADSRKNLQTAKENDAKLAPEDTHPKSVKKPTKIKTEKPDEEKKEAPAKGTKEVVFPVEVFVNKYGFLRLNAPIMTKFLGHTVEYTTKGNDVGKDIKLLLNIEDGKLILAPKKP